jgi:hypothetical protein
MTPATLIASIINGEYDDDIDRIFRALRSRENEIRRRAAQVNLITLTPGTRVRLKDLSPKYLNGLTGVVKASRGARITVELDTNTDRFGKIVRPPASCVEAIA